MVLSRSVPSRDVGGAGQSLSEDASEPNLDALTAASDPFRLVTTQLAITPRVSVVIAAKNEAANLPHVFASMPDWIDEVVLVDGRSTDDTVAVACQLWSDIKIIQQQGRGKGDALLAGFAASTGEIIVAMDADGSTDGGEIVRFVTALLSGADLVKGSRFAAGGGSSDITAIRRLGNRILSGLVNHLFGTRYTDLCYGFNAFWARHLHVLALRCEGFEIEALMNIRAAEEGLKVHEVPSFEHSRVHGSSNLRVMKAGWGIIRVILREWLRRHSPRRPTEFADDPSLALPAAEFAGVTADLFKAESSADLWHL